MEYLLGSGVVGLGVGAIVLGIYIARQGSANRSDLHKLVQSGKDLADTRRDNDGYRRSVEELQHVLKTKEDELQRERTGLAIARKALTQAQQKLADSGDASGVSSGIDAAFERLSKMSAVSETSPADNGDD